jgi:ribose transport system substrate-binding protein
MIGWNPNRSKILITVMVSIAMLVATMIGVGGASRLSVARADRAAASELKHSIPAAVPKAVRKYYGGFWYFAKIMGNPYVNWTPPKPPWQFCYNESYLGNAWRQESLAEYEKLVKEYKRAGLAKGNLIVTNSDNNIDVQLSQLNSLVREGCNVIISIPGSPTGLCSGVKNAFVHHILFITDESPVYCPWAINVTFNDYWDAHVTSTWLFRALHGRGNVILENGIPGLSDTVAERAGVQASLNKYPGIKVLGEITGMWTPSIAKTATLRFLATHPQKVDGVWDGGQMAVAAEQALMQSGRPLAMVTDFSGECSFLAFWHQYHLKSFAVSQGGGPALYEAFYVAVRMLYGQRPVVNTIMYPVPTITQQNFSKYYKPWMTVQSTCFANPPDGRAVRDSYFNVFFKGGKSPSVAPRP